MTSIRVAAIISACVLSIAVLTANANAVVFDHCGQAKEEGKEEGKEPCKEGDGYTGVCINTESSFTCECATNYVSSPKDPKNCIFPGPRLPPKPLYSMRRRPSIDYGPHDNPRASPRASVFDHCGQAKEEGKEPCKEGKGLTGVCLNIPVTYLCQCADGYDNAIADPTICIAKVQEKKTKRHLSPSSLTAGYAPKKIPYAKLRESWGSQSPPKGELPPPLPSMVSFDQIPSSFTVKRGVAMSTSLPALVKTESTPVKDTKPEKKKGGTLGRFFNKGKK